MKVCTAQCPLSYTLISVCCQDDAATATPDTQKKRKRVKKKKSPAPVEQPEAEEEQEEEPVAAAEPVEAPAKKKKKKKTTEDAAAKDEEGAPAEETERKPGICSDQKFVDLQLSERTQMALTDMGFKYLSHIQAESIAPLLGAVLPVHPACMIITLTLVAGGRDLLGAAQTGSGKTLAFLIPCTTPPALATIAQPTTVCGLIVDSIHSQQ